MYKRNRMNTRLGTYLAAVGMCYVADLQMVGRMYGRDATVSDALKSMRADGYLDEVELKGEVSRTVKAVSLTKKGRLELLNVMDGEEYDYWSKHAKTAERYFHLTDEKKIRRRLENVRAMTMFVCASTPALPKDKPRLSDLYETMMREVVGVPPMKKQTEAKASNIGYRSMTAQECKAMLDEKGVYYTITEYREFCEEYGTASTDTFRGTRARGIFLSDKNCYVIYICKYGDNKMIKVGRFEQSLLSSLRGLLAITSVERVMPQFSTKVASESGVERTSRVKNEPYAVVINRWQCDGVLHGDGLCQREGYPHEGGEEKEKGKGQSDKL